METGTLGCRALEVVVWNVGGLKDHTEKAMGGWVDKEISDSLIPRSSVCKLELTVVTTIHSNLIILLQNGVPV